MVLDASAAVRALLDGDQRARDVRARVAATSCHAPHLFDAELGQALRGLERAGIVAASEADALRHAASALIDQRYPHEGGLAERAWDLRHNLSFYDALYVALAAALDTTLLTADARLVGAPRLPCDVELV